MVSGVEWGYLVLKTQTLDRRRGHGSLNSNKVQRLEMLTEICDPFAASNLAGTDS